MEHKIKIGDARVLDGISDSSIDLVVTSPPYPMVKMWDELFLALNPEISKYIDKDGNKAFELMNIELDKVWTRLWDAMKPGSFVCINTGDATRKIGDNFQCFWNGARIIKKMTELGFLNLPEIIWNKPTNSPTKFMGSGTLPAGAYVTLEYEHILIFKKPGVRTFDKELRRKSAFFYEERNLWFSNIWKILGTKQKIKDKKSKRTRNGAYPFEIPYRLINMYSLQGDTILDPFFGTGTTAMAAIASKRNSIGFEIDATLSETMMEKLNQDISFYNQFSEGRLSDHVEYIKTAKREFKHRNDFYEFEVVSGQERFIELPILTEIKVDKLNRTVTIK